MEEVEFSTQSYYIRSLQRDILFTKNNCSKDVQDNHPYISLKKMVISRDEKLKQLENDINRALYEKFNNMVFQNKKIESKNSLRHPLAELIHILNKLIKNKFHG